MLLLWIDARSGTGLAKKIGKGIEMAPKTLIVERDVDVPMRDGVVLRADVYRPNMSKPLPVLVQRTPYGKGFARTAFCLLAAERGYAVVNQDVRGRWASDGEDYPFLHEMNDGYDSVEWAAHQPWADGSVGMYGLSYMGYTQLAAAALRPPSLKTIIPTQTFCDPYSIIYQGGALALGVSVSWNLLAGVLMPMAWHRRSEQEQATLTAQLVEAMDGMAGRETFNVLPLRDIPLIGRDGFARLYLDSLEHPTRDDFWKRVQCPHRALDLPIFHIGGWYDIFVANTLRDYAGIGEAGNTQQRMMIGPWTHGAFDSKVGEVDFGLQSSAALVLPDELQLRWFDYWLKGIDNGVMQEPPVRIFVMGANRWRSENEWPLARARPTAYYLHSRGGANSLNGDGALTLVPPSDEPVDSYVYDPRNPVPTRGGGLCCYSPALPPGAFDQRDVEARPDVLVYATPPLEEDLEVTGPIEAHLWAATTAPDTDFTAKLVDVAPCGYARNLADGIIRARARDSVKDPFRPGDVYEYVVDLGGTSNVFKAGHQVRLEISSSNFPRFDRNPNTGHAVGGDAELRTALQTVLHDAHHASYILLPIIPE
jgi:putative CocE/NonD family hydrolase